jgi:hypothetical protein
MKPKQCELLCTMASLTFALALTGATPLAAQSGCQPVFDALNKVITTPTHIYSTMDTIPKNAAKPPADETMYVETIYLGASVYTKFAGTWSLSPVTPQQVMKQEQENRKNSKPTCAYLRDEQVDGETAAVYSIRADTSDRKSAGQVWISKSRALPLRQELDIDTVDKSAKNHHTMRYEYTNVQPPPLSTN